MSYQNFVRIFTNVNGEKMANLYAKIIFERYRTFYGKISEADAYSIAREFKGKNERACGI